MRAIDPKAVEHLDDGGTIQLACGLNESYCISLANGATWNGKSTKLGWHSLVNANWELVPIPDETTTDHAVMVEWLRCGDEAVVSVSGSLITLGLRTNSHVFCRERFDGQYTASWPIEVLVGPWTRNRRKP